MGLGRLALKLRMELDGHIEGLRWQLQYFNKITVRALTRESHPMRFELTSVQIVELVAVAMTFRNGVGMIRNLSSGVFGQVAGLRSEPHGSSHVGHFALLIQEANDGCGRIFVELR